MSSVYDTQPREFKPSLTSVLSLPWRICNPPPAVGKVRSCGVTPLFNVRLEDVLDRKHLPPLGLKDFEEWLLYVERSPENLYFILWLKEYTIKYNQWTAQTKSIREEIGEHRIDWSTHTSSQLSLFYMRAKQTFFMPNADYELNLASNILAPFHVVNGSPHPDPLVFTEVAIETQKMLEESLRRFVNGQLKNVGNNRVLCGIIAGFIFCLAGSVPPIAVNFIQAQSRWSRLAAFPGLWAGLTILLAAFNGVCMGVYIFGDLRQLRKFELARPPISKPQQLRSTPHDHTASLGQRPPSLKINSSPPIPAPLPAVHFASSHTLSRFSSRSSDTGSYASSSSASIRAQQATIHISPAFYDADPIDGPATSTYMPDSYYAFPPRPMPVNGGGQSDSFTTTATFIHPFQEGEDEDLETITAYPQERQVLSSFDFDLLPLPPNTPSTLVEQPSPNHHNDRPKLTINTARITPTAIIANMQTKCNIKKWASGVEKASERSISPSNHSFDSSASNPRPKILGPPLRRRVKNDEVTLQKRYRLSKAVPAFATLTRVLSPVIVRGQWEIVVRSAFLGLLISWIVLGSLLAVPVPR